MQQCDNFSTKNNISLAIEFANSEIRFKTMVSFVINEIMNESIKM